jgi:hypothetical protein
MNESLKLTLEEEVEQIKKNYFELENITKSLIEMRTARWIKLGFMLNDHQQHVLSEGKAWTIWVAEKFPFLKQRRREQAMYLANIAEEKLEPYYFMGIDRLYGFFKKLVDYHADPELKDVCKELNFAFGNTMDTDEDKEEFNRRSDQVLEYFKFKGNFKKEQYDKGLLIDVLKTRAKFTPSDYEDIKELVKNNKPIDDFLMNMIVTGTSPSVQNSAGASQESIHIIIGKLEQTIDVYISLGKIPLYLSKEAVKNCYEKMSWLMTKCNEV